MSFTIPAMQLSFDAADRLVELVEARRGPVPADEAARILFALASAPTAVARSLLDDVVSGDARLAWRGASVGLAAPPGADVALENAHFVVVDLETTGLSPRTSRICEIGAQRVRALALEDAFETLVDPRVALPAAVASLTGIRSEALRGAPRSQLAVRRLLAFTGDAAIVAHNARFDLAFLDREVELLTGRRIAAPVVDTVWLARRLLGERTRKVGLASLAHFFGVPTEPCHRALPDARATAEILVVLVGLAQERGARTLADLVELAAPRARRLHAKRSLVAGAPPRPGVYVFRGRGGVALYVGRARDLRARLRSYFASGRQRPAVEAALGALEEVEWRETGWSSRRPSRSFASCASSGRRPTRGARGRTGTSTSADGEAAGVRPPTRRRSVRCPAAGWHGSPRARSTATARTTSMSPCHPSATGYGSSGASFASRTPRGCATASRGSRKPSRRCASSSASDR